MTWLPRPTPKNRILRQAAGVVLLVLGSVMAIPVGFLALKEIISIIGFFMRIRDSHDVAFGLGYFGGGVVIIGALCLVNYWIIVLAREYLKTPKPPRTAPPPEARQNKMDVTGSE